MRTFTIAHSSPLGELLISGNDSFISGIRYADLHSELADEAIPASEAPPLLRRCALHLDEYFAGWRRTFGLQFQQEGTSFQQTVWQELLKIPFGETRTYGKLAQQIGSTKSSRAVGLANGKNQIAIIIPCHRIIGASGNLTGYNGGMWRKKWLLDHEKRIAYGVLSLF